MFRSLVLASVLALAAPVAPALADPTVTIQLGVHDADWGRHRDRDRNISRREAVRIAYSYGVTDIRDVDLRGGVWEINGRTHRGGRVEIEISARTGRVIDVDYGRDRRRGWDDDRGRSRGW